MVDGSEKYRSFYAKLICTAANLDNPRVEEASRSVKPDPFADAMSASADIAQP